MTRMTRLSKFGQLALTELSTRVEIRQDEREMWFLLFKGNVSLRAHKPGQI